MHRIDTPTAEQDKFGQGKNGFTNGDPATGRRATDLNSDMWDAVQEEISNVIEKSGLVLNKSQHDQLYQAVVRIITSKIPDALLKSNNLSDVVNKAAALVNLGGVPNTRKVNGRQLNADITITATDVKALALTTVRAQVNPSAGNVGNADELPQNATSFVYSNAGNAPKFTGSLLDFSGLGGGYNTQIAAAYASAGEIIGFRTRNGDSKNWNPWYELYHTGNKPAATDVGALPFIVTQLGVNLNALGATTSAGVYFQPSNANATPANNYPIAQAGSLLVTLSAYGCQQEYTSFGTGRKFVRGLSGPWNGSGPWGAWSEYLLTTGNAVSASKLQNPRTIAGVAFDGQSNIGIPAGNVGAYTKAEVNNLVNARGAKSTASIAVNGWHRDGDTGFIMQWGQVGGGVGNVAITFPIPFPNACLGMSNTVIGGGGELNWSTVRSTSRTGATIGRDSGAFWQAWGN